MLPKNPYNYSIIYGDRGYDPLTGGYHEKHFMGYACVPFPDSWAIQQNHDLRFIGILLRILIPFLLRLQMAERKNRFLR
jgi:hypothetical protein